MLNKKTKYVAAVSSLIVLCAVTVFFSSTTYAALNAGGGGSTPAGVTQIQNPINVSSFSDFIAEVLGILLKIGIPVVAAFIIYSGLMFVLARGNATELEVAKQRFLYTLIGAALLLGAWTIAQVISATVTALTSH